MNEWSIINPSFYIAENCISSRFLQKIHRRHPYLSHEMDSSTRQDFQEWHLKSRDQITHQRSFDQVLHLPKLVAEKTSREARWLLLSHGLVRPPLPSLSACSSTSSFSLALALMSIAIANEPSLSTLGSRPRPRSEPSALKSIVVVHTGPRRTLHEPAPDLGPGICPTLDLSGF